MWWCVVAAVAVSGALQRETDLFFRLSFALPLAGREGKLVQSRAIRDRLFKELDRNVALKVYETDSADTYEICGRGQLHLTVLIENMRREGFELMIALDVSNSMLAEDLQPNRLERAKQSISKTIDKLKGDKIGVVVFAGEAYVQLPMTTDYAAAKLFLSTIGTDIVPTQGTAIGKAIELSIESFAEAPAKNRAIIVITDGENHEDDAIAQAKNAVEKGIVVHTIGIGSPEGTPIPLYSRGRKSGFRKDRAGNTVVTKLNEQALQEIASAGDGIYIRANNTQTGLKILFDELNKLEKAEFGTKMFTDYEDRFQYFIAAALLLLVLELLISERKSKWFRNFNLFEVKK